MGMSRWNPSTHAMSRWNPSTHHLLILIMRSPGVDEEYAQGEAGAQSTTYAYTRVDSPAGLLDLQVVDLQQLSKLMMMISFICSCRNKN
jgi:hypothetical protein